MLRGAHRIDPRLLAAFLLLTATAACTKNPSTPVKAKDEVAAATGSSQCKTCHPAFYKKWSTSHHGLAMQPFTRSFCASLPDPAGSAHHGRQCLLPRRHRWRAGYVEERGPKGVRKLSIQHVMGGKNTYYFLTPLERGRLQTLPLAYDIPEKALVRHGRQRRSHAHRGSAPISPLQWTDSAFTFNTACYSCHVSQLRNQLRPRHRYLPHHLDGARHQLRNVPRRRRRAHCTLHEGPHGKASGHADPAHHAVHRRNNAMRCARRATPR